MESRPRGGTVTSQNKTAPPPTPRTPPTPPTRCGSGAASSRRCCIAPESDPSAPRPRKHDLFSAEDQLRAISAILDKAGIKGLVGNFLRVVAQNRRLFAVPGMIRAFRQIAAEARGEVSADVISAHALSAAQENELKAALKSVAGKDVTVNLTVDPSILGGLVVKMGSRQIDTSLKTKLNSLKLALKEVG